VMNLDNLGLSHSGQRELQEELGRRLGFDSVAQERIAELEAELAAHRLVIWELLEPRDMCPPSHDETDCPGDKSCGDCWIGYMLTNARQEASPCSGHSQ